MAVIKVGASIATLINVFTVTPERQQELVELLVRATDETMRHLPGFISANIHKSSDGTRVVNYAQWQSREHFQAMLGNPVAKLHMETAPRLAISVEPRLYEVVSVHEGAEAPVA